MYPCTAPAAFVAWSQFLDFDADGVAPFLEHLRRLARELPAAGT